LFSLDSTQPRTGVALGCPTGAIQDDYAVPEEELIPLGESILDTTMIYVGTIQPNKPK